MPRPSAGHRDPQLLIRHVWPVLANDSPLVDDEDAVGERENLVELQRDQEDSPPLIALLDEALVDELDGAYVEPPGRLCGDEHPRVAAHLACDDELLLVPAR